jgi:hypothetical protein
MRVLNESLHRLINEVVIGDFIECHGGVVGSRNACENETLSAGGNDEFGLPVGKP